MEWVIIIATSGVVSVLATFLLDFYFNKRSELKAALLNLDYIIANLKSKDLKLDDFISMTNQVLNIQLLTDEEAIEILGIIDRDPTMREFSDDFLEIDSDIFKNLIPDFEYYIEHKEKLSELFIKLAKIQMHINIIIAEMERISISTKIALGKSPGDVFTYAQNCQEFYKTNILKRCNSLKIRVKEAVELAEYWRKHIFNQYKELTLKDF